MELSKDEINALNWVANGEKAKCEEDEDKFINAFKALDKIGNDDKIICDISEITSDFRQSAFFSNAVIVPIGAEVSHSGKVEIKVCPKEKQVLPRPLVCDSRGNLFEDYSPRDWYLKLQEEIFEVFEDAKLIDQFEIADVITTCISCLESLGYDEKARNEIFAKVNEKNKKRGYFKEC